MLVAVLGAMYMRINTLKAEQQILVGEKIQLKILLEGSQANVTQLQNDIQFQNDAANKLKTEADERLAKNAVKVREAQAVASTYKKRAEDLLKSEAPPEIPRCNAANDLINQEIKNATK